jgi:hypothetical protein
MPGQRRKSPFSPAGWGILQEVQFIQSAYLRDANYASNRPERKPIGFFVILFNTLNNKPIKTPKYK